MKRLREEQTAPMSAITDVGGIRVGQHHRLDPDVTLGNGWASGTTVVLTPPGTVGAVDVPWRRAGHPRDRPARPHQLACVTSTPWCCPAAAPSAWPPPTA